MCAGVAAEPWSSFCVCVMEWLLSHRAACVCVVCARVHAEQFRHRDAEDLLWYMVFTQFSLSTIRVLFLCTMRRGCGDAHYEQLLGFHLHFSLRTAWHSCHHTHCALQFYYTYAGSFTQHADSASKRRQPGRAA